MWQLKFLGALEGRVGPTSRTSYSADNFWTAATATTCAQQVNNVATADRRAICCTTLHAAHQWADKAAPKRGRGSAAHLVVQALLWTAVSCRLQGDQPSWSWAAQRGFGAVAQYVRARLRSC